MLWSGVGVSASSIFFHFILNPDLLAAVMKFFGSIFDLISKLSPFIADIIGFFHVFMKNFVMCFWCVNFFRGVKKRKSMKEFLRYQKCITLNKAFMGKRQISQPTKMTTYTTVFRSDIDAEYGSWQINNRVISRYKQRK